MDAEISKMTQKILGKQGMKFMLNTKVLSGDDSGETLKLDVEASKGGKKQTVFLSQRAGAYVLVLIVLPA